ncbi:ATP-binding protein [Paenibacillus chungangensis]|uniref:histidine kinase n=1 Tax=Paenibacillus chungangensis TaxID=696535 RepID=A0ABW3HVD1_9BACL
MLKDLLLQFFLSVLPVFAFLLWHDKERGWQGFKVFITATSGVAMILCILTSTQLHVYDLDFRMVPLVIGSLYGGFRSLAILSALYILLRIPFLETTTEVITFVVFMLVVVPLLSLTVRKFQNVSSLRRERIGTGIIAGIILYCTLSMNAYLLFTGIGWSYSVGITFLLAAIGLWLACWLSIYIIEGITEKQSLYDEVKQLSASYRNEVEKLQQFIDKAPLAVMIVDPEGKITHANEESVKLLSLKEQYMKASSLLNEKYDDVFQRDAGGTGKELLHGALNGSASTLTPYLEEEKMLLYTSVAMWDVTEQHISGAAIIAQDITELSQLRNEVGRMERLSLVGQMAASITHEIRNPMAVIRGFVQLIQERSPESQFEYFRIIMEELDRTNLIINDFLSLAQNRELKMEPVSLNNTIKDLVPLLSADANLRGQTLDVNLCDNLPLMMLNDREMKQMLLNLARNGMEAMEEKGVLSISTTYTDDEICVCIADEGIGIPEDKINRLFEPFYSTKTRGTGLGLPLCLSIAERHRGRIDVTSNAGQGTTFHVTFNISTPIPEHNKL